MQNDVRGGISAAQARLLRFIADVGESVTIADLSDATGLHENTIRGHLSTLLALGMVTRMRLDPAGRGRPAWSYLARENPYAALATALAAGITADSHGDPSEVGAAGGRAWGERLRKQLGVSPDTSRDRLLLALEHTGFAPEQGEDGAIRLTHCPFLDAARAHPAAVCNVHRGVLEALLGEPSTTVELTPFAQPGTCLVTVTEAAP